MSREDDLIYVGHMLDMTRKALAGLETKSRLDYDADEILRMGLAHIVQVIGEAARKNSPEFQSEYPEIPWRQIIGMRNRIVHDYMRVDEDVLWEVVRKDLPALLTYLENTST